jgi:hypothetical protein
VFDTILQCKLGSPHGDHMIASPGPPLVSPSLGTTARDTSVSGKRALSFHLERGADLRTRDHCFGVKADET